MSMTVKIMNYISDKGLNGHELLVLKRKVSSEPNSLEILNADASLHLDRKPVDPPPIIQLKIRDDHDPAQYVLLVI